MKLNLDRYLKDKPYTLADVDKELHAVNPSRSKGTLYNYTKALRPQRKSKLGKVVKQPSLDMLSDILKAIQRLNSQHGEPPVSPNDLLDLSDNAYVRLDFPGASRSITADTLPQVESLLARDEQWDAAERLVLLAMTYNQMGWEQDPNELAYVPIGFSEINEQIWDSGHEFDLLPDELDEQGLNLMAIQISWRLEISTAFRHHGRAAPALNFALNALHVIADLLNKSGADVLEERETPDTLLLRALEANALYALGACYRMLGKLGIATRYVRTAEAVATDIGAHSTAAKAGIELALLFIDNNEPVRALDHLDRLFGHLPAIGEHRVNAYAHVAAAEAHFALANRGRYTKAVIEEGANRKRAEYHLDKADEIFDQIQDARGSALNAVVRALISTLPVPRGTKAATALEVGPGALQDESEFERAADLINKYDLYLHQRLSSATALNAAIRADRGRAMLHHEIAIRIHERMAASEAEIDADEWPIAGPDAFPVHLSWLQIAELLCEEGEFEKALAILDPLCDGSARNIPNWMLARAHLTSLRARRNLSIISEKPLFPQDELWAIYDRAVQTLQTLMDERELGYAHLLAAELLPNSDETLRMRLEEIKAAQRLFEKLGDLRGLAGAHRLTAATILEGPFPFNRMPLSDRQMEGYRYKPVKRENDNEQLFKTTGKSPIAHPAIVSSNTLGNEQLDELYEQLVLRSAVPHLRSAAHYFDLIGGERGRISSFESLLWAVIALIDAGVYDAAMAEVDALLGRDWKGHEELTPLVAEACLHQARIHWYVFRDVGAALKLHAQATSILSLSAGDEAAHALSLGRALATDWLSTEMLNVSQRKDLERWLVRAESPSN